MRRACFFLSYAQNQTLTTKQHSEELFPRMIQPLPGESPGHMLGSEDHVQRHWPPGQDPRVHVWEEPQAIGGVSP